MLLNPSSLSAIEELFAVGSKKATENIDSYDEAVWFVSRADTLGALGVLKEHYKGGNGEDGSRQEDQWWRTAARYVGPRSIGNPNALARAQFARCAGGNTRRNCAICIQGTWAEVEWRQARG